MSQQSNATLPGSGDLPDMPSGEASEVAPTIKLGPICPHCFAEPLDVKAAVIIVAGDPLFAFHCAGCRKVINLAIPVRTVAAPEKPKVVPYNRPIFPGRKM